ncbi:hypothetical protein [Bacillus subtilis]|uniref:hypothetical protein n=1 Tax=Bacillus subtilis TaxID=1423 RepID=UPI00202AB7D2|nr:hypothetical protein [Bacillus subtilis]
MYFIETQEGLIGKEVAYVWANQFCEQTTIITKDGRFMTCQQAVGMMTMRQEFIRL